MKLIAVLLLMALFISMFVFPAVYIALEIDSGRNPFAKIIHWFNKDRAGDNQKLAYKLASNIPLEKGLNSFFWRIISAEPRNNLVNYPVNMDAELGVQEEIIKSLLVYSRSDARLINYLSAASSRKIEEEIRVYSGMSYFIGNIRNLLPPPLAVRDNGDYKKLSNMVC